MHYYTVYCTVLRIFFRIDSFAGRDFFSLTLTTIKPVYPYGNTVPCGNKHRWSDGKRAHDLPGNLQRVKSTAKGSIPKP